MDTSKQMSEVLQQTQTDFEVGKKEREMSANIHQQKAVLPARAFYCLWTRKGGCHVSCQDQWLTEISIILLSKHTSPSRAALPCAVQIFSESLQCSKSLLASRAFPAVTGFATSTRTWTPQARLPLVVPAARRASSALGKSTKR